MCLLFNESLEMRTSKFIKSRILDIDFLNIFLMICFLKIFYKYRFFQCF